MIHEMTKVGISRPTRECREHVPGGGAVGGRRTIATEAHVPASYMALASAGRDKR
jgi:hypothetical protein